MAQLRLGLVLLLVSILPICAQTPPAKSKPKNPPAKDLAEQKLEILFGIYEEAYGVAQQLNTEDRAGVLTEICQGASFAVGPQPTGRAWVRGVPQKPEVAKGAEKYADRMKQWAEELFRTADELDGPRRFGAQSAAIRAMARYDGERALEMLDGINPPDYGQYDSRGTMAIFVFSKILESRGPEIVPLLRSRAIAIGDADPNAYPYTAMNAVMDELGGHRDLIQQLFADSLRYYRQSSEPINPTFGMLGLLRSEKITSNLEPSQVHEAAQEIAERMRLVVEQAKQGYESGKGFSPGTAMVVRTVRDGLKQIDPTLAASIPEPPPVSGGKKSTPTIKPPKPIPSQADPEVEKLAQEFRKTSTSLMIMSENEVHSGRELQQVIDKGVDQGATVVSRTMGSEDKGSTLGQQRMSGLLDFVQVGTRVNAAMTLAAVRRVTDPLLKARLLLNMANMLDSVR